MKTIEFNLETFIAGLGMFDPMGSQWCDIGMNDLTPNEQSLLHWFLFLAAGGTNPAWDFFVDTGVFDASRVLLARADEKMEFIKDVYGPALFAKAEDSNDLILSVGANSFPVVVSPGASLGDPYLHIGGLSGVFETQSNDNGSWIKIRAWDASRENPEISYLIGCQFFDRKNPPDLQTLLKCVNIPDALVSHFAVKKESGGASGIASIGDVLAKDEYPTFKMGQLPAGVYLPVLGITRFPPKDPTAKGADAYKAFPTFLLNIDNKFSVWLSGKTIGGQNAESLWPNNVLPATIRLSTAGKNNEHISARFLPKHRTGLEGDTAKALAIASGKTPAIAPAIDTQAAAVEEARAALETPPPAIMVSQPKPVAKVDLDAMPF